MVYPELLCGLVGEKVYMRCNRGIASCNAKVQQAAIKALQVALLMSPAFTDGFRCSVSFGWKAAQPGEGRLQKTLLRPAEPRNIPAEPPGEGWEIISNAGRSDYAVRVVAKGAAGVAGRGSDRSM